MARRRASRTATRSRTSSRVSRTPRGRRPVRRSSSAPVRGRARSRTSSAARTIKIVVETAQPGINRSVDLLNSMKPANSGPKKAVH